MISDTARPTRQQLQEALMETAWSLYWKGKRAQYDSLELTRFQNKQAGAALRLTLEVAPEYATSHTTLFSVCSGLVYTTYFNTLRQNGEPYRINGSYIWYTCAHMLDRMPGSAVLLRWIRDEEATKRFAHPENWLHEPTTNYCDWTGKDLWCWFRDNWQTVLQPGDMCITFRPSGAHVTLYVGGGMLMEAAGRKFNKVDHIEPDGTYCIHSVHDYYVSGTSCKSGIYRLDKEDFTAFCILRPLNLLVGEDDRALPGVTISETSAARVKYPGLDIDRTVNITPCGTAVQGGELCYSVKLTNHSNSQWRSDLRRGSPKDVDTGGIAVHYPGWRMRMYGLEQYEGQTYENLTVTEPIPQETCLVPESISHGGRCENGLIRWNLDLAAGETAELTYRVKVTGKIGETVVSTGGFVDVIPSNTIRNRIGGQKPAPLVKISGEGMAFAEDYYQRIFGWQVKLPDPQTLFAELFRPLREEPDCNAELAEQGLLVPDRRSLLWEWVVDRFFGGLRIHTKVHGFDRILDIDPAYLETGDILLTSELTDDQKNLTNTMVQVYTDTGDFVHREAGLRSAQARAVLEDAFNHDVFLLLRPSQARERQ